MNNQALLYYLKKYWYLLAVVGVFILLLLLAVMPPSQEAGQTLPITRRPNLPQTTTPTLNLNTQANLPQEARTYTSSTPNLESFTQVMVQNLQLSPHSQSSRLWTNADQTIFLTPLEAIHSVQLSYRREEAATTPNLSQSLSVTRKFLSQYTSFDITILEDQVEFLNNTPEPQVVNPQEADLIRIPFAYTLDSRPLYINNQPSASGEVVINGNYQVVSAIIPLQPTSFEVQSTQDLLPPQQALELNQNQMIITKVDTTPEQLLPPEEIRNTHLTNVQLTYRLSSVQNHILPYYQFSGTTKEPTTNQTLDIEIIVPAIKL